MGIVLGDALGIPTQWFQLPSGKTEGFKYEDYFKSIGRNVSKSRTVFNIIGFQDKMNFMTPMPIQQQKN